MTTPVPEAASPRPRRSRVTRAVAALVAVGAVAAGAVAVRESLGTDCRPPDVRGLPVDDAVVALESAGVTGAGIEVGVREASDRPQDEVVEQASTACSEPVTLTVSDGGPVVTADDVPDGLLRLLGEDADGPLRQIATAQGLAYKSDARLVGDCPAVEAAAADVSDPEYAVACRPSLGERLDATVADAVRAWRGAPGPGVPFDIPLEAPVEGRVVPWYAGTWWGGRTTHDSWRLQAAVTITGGEIGTSPDDALRPDAEEAVLFVVRVRGGAVSDVVLLPPEGLSRADAGPAPVGLTEIRDLADRLLTEATTA